MRASRSHRGGVASQVRFSAGLLGVVAQVVGLVALAGVAPLGAEPAAPEGRIAYLVREGPWWQVGLMAPDGTATRVLTHSASEKARLSWYPDGKSLLVSTHGGHALRVDVETGAEEPVALPLEGSVDAVLAPDGSQLAFSASPAGSRDDHEVFVLPMAGGAPRRLTSERGVQHQPAWTRDGGWLYYLSGLTADDHTVWRVRPTGGPSEAVRLTDGFHFEVAPGPGDRLAFSGNASGNYEIWLRDGQSELRRLTDHPALDGAPSFSPDGEHIVFESARSGQVEIWKIPTEGGESVQLTRSKAGARRPVWWVPREPQP